MDEKEKLIDEKTIKEGSKKLMAGAAVATAVFGMGLAGDMLGDDDDKILPEVQHKVSAARVAAQNPPDVFDRGVIIDGVEEAESHKLLSMLGSVLFAPFWLLAKLLSPVLNPILHVLVLAVGLFVAIVVALKIKYPDVPLKEILSKKNVILIFSGIFAVFCLVSRMPLLVPDLDKYMNVAKIACAAVLFVVVVTNVKVLRPKEKKLEIVF